MVIEVAVLMCRLQSLVPQYNLVVASYDIVRNDIEFFRSANTSRLISRLVGTLSCIRQHVLQYREFLPRVGVA